MFESINLLKTIAAALVFNSHLEEVWPVQALATGGALGNALFFFVAGYLCVNVKEKFGIWYLKRLRRIWLPGFCINLFYILVGFTEPPTVARFLMADIWAGGFWFCGAMLVFYPLYYIAVSGRFWEKFLQVSAILGILYIIGYTQLDLSTWSIEAPGSHFKFIYYFYLMLWGGKIRKEGVHVSQRILVSGAAAGFLSLYGGKGLFQIYPSLLRFQFLNQVSVGLFGICFASLAIMNEERIKSWSPVILRITKRISDISLELYLTCYLCISWCQKLFFPLNLVAAVLLSVIAASIFHWLQYPVRKKQRLKNT